MNSSLRKNNLDITIKHFISYGIAKNNALLFCSKKIELFALVLFCWRLQFLFELNLPFFTLMIEEIV